MHQAQYRVAQEKPRSGVPHYAPDFFAHFRFITMDRTVAAHWFIRAERAFVDPFKRILEQARAIRAESDGESMVAEAVYKDQYFDRFFFPNKLVHEMCQI